MTVRPSPERLAKLRAEILRHGGPVYALELLAEIDALVAERNAAIFGAVRVQPSYQGDGT